MVGKVLQSTTEGPQTGVEAHCACACFRAAHHPKHVTEKQCHVIVGISSSTSTIPTLTELRMHPSSMLLESL